MYLDLGKSRRTRVLYVTSVVSLNVVLVVASISEHTYISTLVLSRPKHKQKKTQTKTLKAIAHLAPVMRCGIKDHEMENVFLVGNVNEK